VCRDISVLLLGEWSSDIPEIKYGIFALRKVVPQLTLGHSGE
jgi:hypothetical protein